MTDTPADNPHPESVPEIRPEIRQWCDAWRICLQDVLSQVSGQPNAFEISLEGLPSADSDVWYTVVVGGAAHGEMSLRLPAASGARLAQKFLGETAPPTEAGGENGGAENISPEHKEALDELLRQIAGLAATALGSTLGGEVQLHLSPAGTPSWSSDAVVGLQTRDEAGTAITLEIQTSPALAAELQARLQPAASPQASAPVRPPVPPATAANYRRLLDVGLDVKLRFGTRRMMLRDVLALSAGVVVELESKLRSPVDLLLDDRLIAQGEVVIVDGKYGLRITDVVDPAPPAVLPA
ncbi:MAG: FliM/FliN family flagellar motor switch protein [Terriglobales bacterium]|jgi:flagellar motor switch protein FliN/FliY